MAGFSIRHVPFGRPRHTHRDHPRLDSCLGRIWGNNSFAGNLEGKTQTMPLAIYIGFEENIKIALVLSVMLLVVSLVFLAFLRKLEEPS